MIKWSKKIKLPADLFSKNSLLTLLAEKIIPGVQANVLDVGDYGSKLSWFLPERLSLTVYGQKPAPEGNHTRYIQGDARKLPFQEKSFDLVISSGLLEDINPEDRLTLIKELVRVSKRYLIIAAPFNNILNKKAEDSINTQYKEITGQDYPPLKEHFKNGLPDLEEIENYLLESNYSYVKLGEGNIYNWYLQQLVQGVKQGIKTSEQLNIKEDKAKQTIQNQSIQPNRENQQNQENQTGQQTKNPQGFNEYFNEHLEELGNFRAPTYRTFICIDKERVLNRQEFIELIEEKNNLYTPIYFEALKKAFDEIQKLLLQEEVLRKTLQLQLEENQKVLTYSNSTLLKEKDQQINLLKARLAEINHLLSEKELLLNNHQYLILTQADKITEISTELGDLKNKLSLNDKQITSQENFLTRLGFELENKHKEIESLKNIIIQKEHNINGRIAEINGKNLQINCLQNELSEHQKSLREIFKSKSWKMVMLYRKGKERLYTEPKFFLKKASNILNKFFPQAFMEKYLRKILKKQQPKEIKNEYQTYVERTKLTFKDIKNIQLEIGSFEYKPLLSVVMPIHNVEEKWLRKALDSVITQIYPKWELCIVDDTSSAPHIKKVLEEYKQKDSRFKIFYRSTTGGKVKALSSALKMAQGGYIIFMAGHDEIPVNAFYEVVKVLQEKKYDLIYSDEDKIEIDETRCEAYFKPDFSPDLLFTYNFIGQLGVYRRKMIEEIGGFREGVEGSEDYDLVLRCTEKERSIFHIPKILYHERKIPKSISNESAKKALSDTLKRRKIKAEVLDGMWKFSYRVKRQIEGEPLVSIIIPFKDKMDILKACLNSIFEKTTYKNYEIILVDNASELLETIEYMKEVENCPRVRLFHYNAPFNYSAINNFAVLQSKGEYLLLLNNDTEVIEPGWIENMLEHAQRPEVGAVGAKLLYPTNLIQHAGVVIGVGVGGISNNAFSKKTSDDSSSLGLINVVRNVSAVTSACLMTRRDVYEKMHGLDEENLAVIFNDIDFCLRLREEGYLIVYTPYALLYHHESLSRDELINVNEEYFIRRRHQGILKKGDPYYNTNLTQERADYSLKASDTEHKQS